MRSTLQSIRARRGQNEKGFTLIELLVVVVIIGILIAIAIPLYLNYQKSSHDKAADSDVRNAAVVIQQCYTDNNTWVTDWTLSDNQYTATDCPDGKINVSPGTTIKFSASADNDGVVLVGTNSDGHGYTYTLDTARGGSVVQGTAAPTTTAG